MKKSFSKFFKAIGIAILIIFLILAVIIFAIKFKFDEFISFIFPSYKMYLKKIEEREKEKLRKATENRGWAFQDLR